VVNYELKCRLNNLDTAVKVAVELIFAVYVLNWRFLPQIRFASTETVTTQ